MEIQEDYTTDNVGCQKTLTEDEMRRGIEMMKASWPTAASLQSAYVNIVKPVASFDDLNLLKNGCRWRWSKFHRSKVIALDICQGVDEVRLWGLLQAHRTAWEKDLGILDIVQGEYYGLNERDDTKSDWRWYTLENAYEDKEPRQYIVENLLVLPSVTILFGRPGELKTMLAQDLALCVAGGKTWLEGLPERNIKGFACKQSSTLWIDVDNGLDRTERRFAALGKTHGIAIDVPLAYTSFPVPPFVASDTESISRIIDAAMIVNAKLIVIDYLGAIAGSADENSSQMIEVMSGLRWIAETTGAAIVVIHHRTKSDKSRMGDSLRGHSSILGAVDLALLVEREEGTDTVTLRSIKSRDAPVKPFEALWAFESDNRDLIAGRFYGMGTTEDEADGKREQAREAILEILSEQPGLSQRKLVIAAGETCDIGKGLLTFALNQLVKENKVIKTEGQRKDSFAYYLEGNI